MRCLAIFILAVSVVSSASAQQSPAPSQQSAVGATSGAVPNSVAESADSVEKGDVIGVTVFDAPELSRNVRVDNNGDIRVPMLRQYIQAAGLSVPELETAIANKLIDEQVLVNPIVTVSIVEAHPRPITIFGAVRTPTTIQITSPLPLIEVLSRAGGLAGNAGSEVFVTRPSSLAGGLSVNLTQRISLESLLDAVNPASNITLTGGEYVRVPEAGQVFVVGNVKHPGVFDITHHSDTSVLKAVSLSGGLDSFSSHTAYIYRVDGTNGQKSQIPIPITKIMARKSPDVPLYGNDMLFVPSVTGQRASAKALSMVLGIGLGLAAILIYVVQ